MQLITDKISTTDHWGFPGVWVPFGKPGKVKGDKGDYNVSSKDILNPASLATLAGVPVYIWHPDETITPETIEGAKAIGITTDKYRLADGGGEVLVKLYDRSTYQTIRREGLIESSPGYDSPKGIRTYNHIAILPEGKARGGAKMRIRLEGFPVEIEETVLEEVINQKNIMTVEEMLGQVLAGQAALAAQLSSLVANEVTEEESVMRLEGEAAKDAYLKEGYEAGMLAGEQVAVAKEYGYEGADATGAIAHTIAKAFPDMKIEGFPVETVKGIYLGAVTALKSAVKAVEPTVAKLAPVVVVEGKAPAKGRLPLKVATAK